MALATGPVLVSKPAASRRSAISSSTMSKIVSFGRSLWIAALRMP